MAEVKGAWPKLSKVELEFEDLRARLDEAEQTLQAIRDGEVDALALQPGEWSLVVKEDRTPLAWINADGVAVHRKGSSLYDSTVGGGSFFKPDGTLRQALDAALSSPTGLGVAVDERGHLIGGVRADDVLEALSEQRRVPELG